MATINLTSKGKSEKFELKKGTTIRDVIAAKGLNDQTIIVKRNKTLAHPDDALTDGDSLELVDIIYGG